jgi:hypothetical protein
MEMSGKRNRPFAYECANTLLVQIGAERQWSCPRCPRRSCRQSSAWLTSSPRAGPCAGRYLERVIEINSGTRGGRRQVRRTVTSR